LLLQVLARCPAASAAQSPACAQARTSVAEIKAMYERGGQPDHRQTLNRLATTRDLCPSYGEAWKYSACAAAALGDEQKARIYRDRAVLNGVTELSCGPMGAPAAAPLGPIRDKYALIVGIGDFPAASEIPRLAYSAKDARDLYAYLTTEGGFPPANVELLVDAAATREGILTAIQHLIIRAHADDLALIYVSSHGSPREDNQGLQGVGYIVTYDTRKASLFVDAIEFQDFSAKVAMIPARRKVTFLDTCYSGQGLEHGGKSLAIGGFGIADDTARLFVSSEGTYVITSSGADEQSWESDERKNSYFTHYLIEALRQGPEPPTLDRVFQYLSRTVTDAVGREKTHRQTPQLYPRGGVADLRIGAPARPNE
jgi:hypothetical protein